MQQSRMLWKRCRAGAQISPRRGSTRLHSSERRNALLPRSRASRRSSSYLHVCPRGSHNGLPLWSATHTGASSVSLSAAQVTRQPWVTLVRVCWGEETFASSTR